MSTGKSGANRQGVRGTGAPVRISPSQATTNLKRLMDKGKPRRGNTYDRTEMAALAKKAGMNPKYFK